MNLALQPRVAPTARCTRAPVRVLPAPSSVRRSTLLRSSDQGATAASEAVPPPTAAPPVDSEAPAVEVPAPTSVADEEPEVLFYEGSGSNVELAISLALAFTLIYAPLSLASLGRRLWINYKFTNKRLTVFNTSPLFKRQVDVSYRNIKEIRAAPRALGLWGDMVIFLKDGSRLELVGLERYQDIKRYIEEQAFRM